MTDPQMAEAQSFMTAGRAVPGGMLDQFDSCLSEQHELIELLFVKLSGIRDEGPDIRTAQPEEAPTNRLHEMLIRLHRSNLRLRSLSGEINL